MNRTTMQRRRHDVMMLIISLSCMLATVSSFQVIRLSLSSRPSMPFRPRGLYVHQEERQETARKAPEQDEVGSFAFFSDFDYDAYQHLKDDDDDIVDSSTQQEISHEDKLQESRKPESKPTIEKEEVGSFAFFSDFDYDSYQHLEEEPDSKPQQLIPDESETYCALDPFYDLSAPYVSRMTSQSTFVEYTKEGLCVPAGHVGIFKEDLASILNEPLVEIVIASVILLNSLLVALSTLDALSDFMPMIRGAEIMVSTIFVVDLAARWFSSNKETGRFVLCPQFVLDILVVILPLVVTLTPDAVMDEVSFLPSALAKPSELFNLRLLRVLRLQRFLRDLDTFERFVERVLGEKPSAGRKIVQDWQLQLARVVSSLFTLLSVVSGLIYTAENASNPNIDNYFDALYFSLTTLTTVGFGDVSPVTWQGKLIVSASIVLGVAIVPAQAAALVEALLDRERARNGNKTTTTQKSTSVLMRPKNKMAAMNNGGDKEQMLALDTTTSCPNCGATFHWSSAQFCYNCGQEL